jgi:hypothetical protein
MFFFALLRELRSDLAYTTMEHDRVCSAIVYQLITTSLATAVIASKEATTNNMTSTTEIVVLVVLMYVFHVLDVIFDNDVLKAIIPVFRAGLMSCAIHTALPNSLWWASDSVSIILKWTAGFYLGRFLLPLMLLSGFNTFFWLIDRHLGNMIVGDNYGVVLEGTLSQFNVAVINLSKTGIPNIDKRFPAKVPATDGVPSDDNKECKVCGEDIVNTTVWRHLPACNHHFHAECIDPWFASNCTCPSCRKNYKEEQRGPNIMSAFWT